ncbi:hypothetical protein C7974DRAFT_591 [Boeremia exigua]|uniref:uncharacterized protein n=1 Tax=Boeremia exigua TaxID=749465 RepID=UPI001E8EBF16|nr:uncharacterized protein C7974DRAFT_591 [Boeremia exigua]KAH6643550.1 hypothetical protein C7974DRAFT_591 [Boeremia exigua]
MQVSTITAFLRFISISVMLTTSHFARPFSALTITCSNRHEISVQSVFGSQIVHLRLRSLGFGDITTSRLPIYGSVLDALSGT